jgi:hypothetical protein
VVVATVVAVVVATIVVAPVIVPVFVLVVVVPLVVLGSRELEIDGDELAYERKGELDPRHGNYERPAADQDGDGSAPHSRHPGLDARTLGTSDHTYARSVDTHACADARADARGHRAHVARGRRDGEMTAALSDHDAGERACECTRWEHGGDYEDCYDNELLHWALLR